MKHITIKKILIPVDFSVTSHKAFHHAKTLAKQFSSDIVLMHVLEDWPFSGIFPFIPDDEDAKLRETYRVSAISQMEKLREELSEAGVKNVYLQYSEGNMAECVRDVSNDLNIDLVVMGTHGSRGPGFLMGSNAYKVVSWLDIPAITVHEKASFGPYSSIVTTIDDSMYSRAKFPYVAKLARAFDSSVEILYPKVEDSGRANLISQYFNQVSEFLEKEKVVHVSKEVDGNFAHEVIKFAEYTNADIIVIMSDTENSISSLLLGSKAQEIITHSTTPVLTLHPDETSEFTGMYF